MPSRLRVVATRPKVVPAPAAAARGDLNARIQQLQSEARGLAADHVATLREQLLQTGNVARQIAAGGDIYPPGVRDIAERLSEDCTAKATTLEAIMERSRR